MRSHAVKVREKKWLYKPNKFIFTQSLSLATRRFFAALST